MFLDFEFSSGLPNPSKRSVLRHPKVCGSPLAAPEASAAGMMKRGAGKKSGKSAKAKAKAKSVGS